MLLRRTFSYLRYFNWYINYPDQMPLCSNLKEQQSLPDLKNVKVFWPNKYSWPIGKRRLEFIRKGLYRLVPIILYDVTDKGFDWYTKGGFPVPNDKYDLIGKPGNPKNSNDIRGEIFEVHVYDKVVKCAYDYSDYPVISTDILNEVDIYFKCMVPVVNHPLKVVSVGYYAKKNELLSKARAKILKKIQKKDIDVYGKFGLWTDSQAFRVTIVEKLEDSIINFVGGFGKMQIYPAYLKELMRAKIALDVPGQGPVSYRLVEAMALGALLVCRKPACIFPEEMKDGMHYVSIKEDASNIVSVCKELLEDDKRRQHIVEQAMCFYDRNFSMQSIAMRILRKAIQFAEE